MRFLVIDDHPLLCKGVRQALHENWPRAQSDLANSLRDGMVQLDADGYDLIILDLQMDDAKGLEALLSCRERTRAPILALGCQGEDQFAMMAMQAGASGCLSKHRNEDEFVRAVRRILSGGALCQRSPGGAPGQR